MRTIILEVSTIPSKIITTVKELKTGTLTDQLLAGFNTLEDNDSVSIFIAAVKCNKSVDIVKFESDQA